MKKFFVSILAFLYLSTSMGATLHLHYCMGKLISWGLINHESANCDFCGMPKKMSGENPGIKKGCCRDEHKEIKSNKDQKLTPSEFQYIKLFTGGTAGVLRFLPELNEFSAALEIPSVHAPPLVAKKAIFLLNRNFRI